MAFLDEVRTVFRDGERLTAGRLNGALGSLRTMLRRTLLGPLSPGVALGLTLSVDNGGDVLTVSPGIAIDRRGRILVLSSPQSFVRAEISAAVGGLGDGETARVGLGLASIDSDDPCGPAPGDVVERAIVRFRKTTVGPFIAVYLPGLGLQVPMYEPTLDVPEACIDATGDLDAQSSDIDGCSVALGSVKGATGGTKLTSGMSNRVGIAPRFDMLRNSFGGVVMELRERALGATRAHFVAPAGGPDVQATRLAQAHSYVAAARVSLVTGNVAELAGGVPDVDTIPDGLPPGMGGALATPLVVQPNTPAVGLGTIVELYQPGNGDPAPVAPGAIRALAEPTRAFGIVGATPYAGPSTTIVAPLTLTGVVRVQVNPGDPEFPIEVGTPLTPINATTLRKAEPAELVVAYLLEEKFGTDPVWAHVTVVHPPRKL